MNVLALLTDAFGGYGGIAQYNRDTIEALAERDDVNAIDIAVRVAPLPIESHVAKVRQFDPVYSRVRYSLRCLTAALARRPQLIFNGHLFHGPLATKLARLTGARVVSQLHGTEAWGEIAAHHLAPLIRSERILCVSEDTRRRLLSLAPQLEDRAFVMPNMVRQHFCAGDRLLARRRLGIGNERVVLTVARLDGRNGYKGHDRVIRMLPTLHGRFAEGVRYLVAGDGEDRPRLEKLAVEAGVDGMVSFLGRVDPEVLPDVYRAADVFAMPSTGEGFGIVYLEAMACGTPAIGIDVGGVADAFAGIEPRWCVPSEAFETSLTAMLELPPPDPVRLSDRVHDRFGAGAFRHRLAEALGL